MLDFPRWKTVGIGLLIALGFLLAIPSFLSPKVTEQLPGLFQSRVNLGLDLAGGSHLLLEADVADVDAARMETMEGTVRRAMRGDTGSDDDIAIGELERVNGTIRFLVSDPTKIDEARERLFRETGGAGMTGQRDWNVEVIDTNRVVLTPTAAGRALFINNAMDSARTVVDRRVNALGTREPTIIREGADRIVVQVPGLQDPQELKDLLGQTARLEFRMVDEGADIAAAAAGTVPVGTEFVPNANAADGPGLVLKRQVLITGDQLTSANSGFNQQNGQSVVNIAFDSGGAATFARVTSANVGRRFAMVLDGKILSAPTINDRILGGQAEITGRFTPDTANQLAIALRSGALPIKLKIVEERTVTPELGADSIQRGMLAAAIATFAVLALMVLTYGRFGVYACIALVINIAMIVAAMALFNATLTLPGIAGFVLTIGAAVDANVLINERIREELRRGRKPIQAIEVGYTEASRAIFDANITNVIAAALMFWFGSGPVKGFAVVLAIGIVTSVFTAVTITRMFVAQWARKARPTSLNI